MVCPKCNGVALIRICMKGSRKNALICEQCETLWFEGENINSYTGHLLRLYTNNLDQELTFDEIFDLDNRSIMKSDIR